MWVGCIQRARHCISLCIPLPRPSDVFQRVWLHLACLFGGSAADIRSQLPAEYARFTTADVDMRQSIMGRVSSAPQILAAVSLSTLPLNMGGHQTVVAAQQFTASELLSRPTGNLHKAVASVGAVLARVQVSRGSVYACRRYWQGIR